ncbi:MAG: hypothetical protein MPN21_15650 [Thermoanaerobaculia bacterium]|nr:hypothetical protein [Thermoanaerobaculia bacterium]
MAKKTKDDTKTKGSKRKARCYLGIDVSGPRRGLFRATIRIGAKNAWRLEGLEQFANRAELERVAWSTPEGMEQVREWVSQGRRGLTSLAEATADDCQAVSDEICGVLEKVGPEKVFVDAPAAFARNSVSHGRATEKANLPRARFEFVRQIPFQVTPTIATGMSHGGLWNWIIRGMMVFYAVRAGGKFDAEGWKEYLHQGCKAAPGDGPPAIECMPTATVLSLRSSYRHKDRAMEIVRAIEAEDEYKAVRVLEIVRTYLESSVGSVKRQAQLYDWADATVAALGCLAYEFRDEFEPYRILGDHHDHWESSERSIKSAQEQEGQVEVPIPVLG